MPDRLAFARTPDQLRQIFATGGALPNWARSWNVAPGAPAPVIRASGDARRAVVLRWGFATDGVPSDGRTASAPPLARAETLAQSRLFGSSFRERRCLVPADAYCAWSSAASGRRPIAFARMDGRPAALGGFWRDTIDDDGEPGGSFAIVTVETTAAIDQPHERAPVIIEEDAWPVWLGERAGDVEPLLRSPARHVLRSWSVDPAIADTANDGPAVLDPID